MTYELKERVNQRTAENRIFDIDFGSTRVGWLDEHKTYAPHVRIMDTKHKLDKKAMLEAIQRQLHTDGSYFLLSDLISEGNFFAVTVDDLKTQAEHLQQEVRDMKFEAEAFLKLHDEKIQGIKELQKETAKILKQIKAQSNGNNTITTEKKK